MRIELAARPGLEPEKTDSESVVLPLHYRASGEIIYAGKDFANKILRDTPLSRSFAIVAAYRRCAMGTIREMADDERPREAMALRGAAGLSDAALVAVIVDS